MKRLAGVLSFCVVLVAGTAGAAPPSNDDRAGAAKIAKLPAISSADMDQSSNEIGEDTSCGSGSVWYGWKAQTADPITVSTRSQSPGGIFGPPPVFVQVFEKDRAVITPIACAQSAITFTPTPGVHYLFRMAGGGGMMEYRWSNGFGAGSNPSNAEHIVAPPFPFWELLGLGFGGLEPGEPAPTCGVAGGSQWHAYTAPAAGIYTAHIDSLVPFYLQVYDASLNPAIGGCGRTLSPNGGVNITRPMLAGERIYIQFGRNVEPGANDQGNIGLGFFTLTQQA